MSFILCRYQIANERPRASFKGLYATL